MSDKKEWREIWVPPSNSTVVLPKDYDRWLLKSGTFFIEKPAYQAEKQRAERAESRAVEVEAKADRLEAERNQLFIQRENFAGENIKLKEKAVRWEKELGKVLGAGRDWLKRALDLDDENQKLKEALAVSEGQEQKLRQALKEIVNTERMNDPNNLLAEHLKTVAREALK